MVGEGVASLAAIPELDIMASAKNRKNALR